MPLNGPCDQDLGKIHSEVNQLVNQRFVLTTVAITVFGVIVAWLIPKTPPLAETSLGWFTIAGAVLLLVLLFLLYLFTHLLRGMLRVFTTYLVVTGTSGWEKDWERFCENKYWAYTKPQSVVFMVLGLCAGIICPLLVMTYSLQWEPLVGFFVLGVVLLLYELFVWLMGFRELWSTGKAAKSRWEELNK